MASPLSEVLGLCMIFAQCFLGCYFCIWLAEAALEYYNAGLLDHVPEAGFYTILAAAIGAASCVLADAVRKREKNGGRLEPPKY